MSMEIIPAATNNNIQAVISKSMVPDLGWLDRDQMKFKDQQREIQLFFKSNRVLKTNNRITVILAHLRGDVIDIYTQNKLDELDKELEIQDWDKFVKEIKTMFSNKTKAADAEQRIESFKQEKKNTADFIIEFKALVMKADTNKLYAIFLLKKNI